MLTVGLILALYPLVVWFANKPWRNEVFLCQVLRRKPAYVTVSFSRHAFSKSNLTVQGSSPNRCDCDWSQSLKTTHTANKPPNAFDVFWLHMSSTPRWSTQRRQLVLRMDVNGWTTQSGGSLILSARLHPPVGHFGLRGDGNPASARQGRTNNLSLKNRSRRGQNTIQWSDTGESWCYHSPNRYWRNWPLVL